jgi:hypothetical protein
MEQISEQIQIQYPHRRGFIMFAFELGQEIKRCFHKDAMIEAWDSHDLAISDNGKALFRTDAEQVEAIDRNELYDRLATKWEQFAEPNYQPNSGHRDFGHGFDCYCSGE